MCALSEHEPRCIASAISRRRLAARQFAQLGANGDQNWRDYIMHLYGTPSYMNAEQYAHTSRPCASLVATQSPG